MDQFRRKPSPAMLVAILALVAALGGTAVAEIATTTLNKPEKKQIRKMAKKIANKVSKRQANRQITRRAPKLTVATASSSESANTANTASTANSATTAGTANAVAANGVDTQALVNAAVTAAKLADVTIRNGTAVSVADGTSRLVSASCNAGEKLLSGGGVWASVSDAVNAAQLHVVHSFPSGGTWATRAYNGSGVARSFTPRAVCLTN